LYWRMRVLAHPETIAETLRRVGFVVERDSRGAFVGRRGPKYIAHPFSKPRAPERVRIATTDDSEVSDVSFIATFPPLTRRSAIRRSAKWLGPLAENAHLLPSKERVWREVAEAEIRCLTAWVPYVTAAAIASGVLVGQYFGVLPVVNPTVQSAADEWQFVIVRARQGADICVGDTVVYRERWGDRLGIARCAALGPATARVENGRLIADGVLIDEPFATGTATLDRRIEAQAGEIVLLSDDRSVAGFVFETADTSDVRATVVAVIPWLRIPVSAAGE